MEPTEGVVVHDGGDLRDLLEQFLEEGAGEKVAGLGQDTGELRVVLLDGPHGLVDPGADVLRLREVEQEIEPGIGGQMEDALGVVRGGFIDPAAAAGGGGGLLRLGTLRDDPRRVVSGVTIFHFQGTGGGLVAHARFAQDAKTPRQEIRGSPLGVFAPLREPLSPSKPGARTRRGMAMRRMGARGLQLMRREGPQPRCGWDNPGGRHPGFASCLGQPWARGLNAVGVGGARVRTRH